MTTETKTCTTCGTPFATSRTGYTVRCPACRTAPRTVAVRATSKARAAEPICACGALTRGEAEAGKMCPRECYRASVRAAMGL